MPPILPPTQLVCFDLGGVLVRICQSWRDTFVHTGTPVPAALDDPRVADELFAMLEPLETGRMDERAFFESYARRIDADVELVITCFNAWPLGVYPGADALLHRVCDCGVATACLSNTNAPHWRVMTETDRAPLPLARLDWRFVSHEIGAMKPDAAAFQHVEDATGLPPASILFFDDLPANCAAARRRGWNAQRIDPHGDTVEQMTALLREFGVEVGNGD